MAAYVIAFMDVKDPARYDAEYVAAVGPLVQKHGGRPLAVAPGADVREGEWPVGRNVVIEFPDRAAAEAWYNDPDYAPMIKLRNSLADGSLAIVDGL